jgi:hypothetical protein
MDRKTVERSISQTIDMLRVYRSKTFRRAKVILLLVSSSFSLNDIQLQDIIDEHVSQQEQVMYDMSVIFVPSEDIKRLSCEQIQSWIGSYNKT